MARTWLKAGHQVLGLARSDAGAKSLAAAGAEVHRGSLEDLESLRSGAAASDGVIHTAFNHDFSKYVANCEADRHVIEAIGSVLVGSDHPLVITSGTAIANTVPGQPALEDNAVASSSVAPRAASEEAAASVAARGVNVSVVRPANIPSHPKWAAASSEDMETTGTFKPRPMTSAILRSGTPSSATAWYLAPASSFSSASL
jgi:nucleoside-diphosphate-sugar epimerase